MKYEQMSIYDFLDGESQEVEYTQADRRQCLPSETQPQVDEAQEDKAGIYKIDDFVPSSALDTDKLISENLVFNPEGYAEKVVELPTEDTDSTLFSVGDTVTVRQASDVYDKYSSPEDYYFMKEYEGMSVILESFDGKSWECYFPKIGRHKRVYPNELIKI